MEREVIYFGSGLALGLILGIGATYFLMRSRAKEEQTLQDHLKSASEQLLLLAKEKLGSEKEEIKTDLVNKKEMIRVMVEEIRRELLETSKRLQKSDEERLSSYSALVKELQTYREVTNELRGSTEDLKKLLSNNQLRGQFGERVAENLLKMTGFVIGTDYVVNKAQEAGTRPDLTLLLPDKTKVNVDVKFPYNSLQKFLESDDEESKKRYLFQFTRDVKEKIKQIATRQYINPQERTVDFAIAFIPNEMIFSFIYDRLNDVWEEGMNKKVILAGPYSFTAILRLIKQAYSNFKFQENIQDIIALIQKFRIEYGKFSDELDLLGSRLESASKQFQLVSTTRDRQLNKIIDQIENQKIIAKHPEDQNLIN